MRPHWAAALLAGALFVLAGGCAESADTTESSGLAADADAGADAVAPDVVVEPTATLTPEPAAMATPAPVAVSVASQATYEVVKTTHTYAQGLSHSEWASATAEPVDLVLDLYEPQGTTGDRPAIVIIHGGGFTGGSRTAAALVSFAEYFAERGWVAASIDYRVAGDRGTIPAGWLDLAQQQTTRKRAEQSLALYPAARDARAAIRWVHANAESYRIDPDHVAVMGGSAGAILSVMAGVADPGDYRDEISVDDDPTLASTNLEASSAVGVVLDYWGSAVLLDALERAYGVERFDETDAPIAIVHGTEDPTVLFSEGERLRDLYEQTGVDHRFVPLEGVGHGAWATMVEGRSLQELGFDFAVEQLDITVE